MQNYHSKISILAIALLVLIFNACKKDDDNTPDNEEELITSVVLTFTPTSGSASTFSFKDTDGDGGNPPIVETIKLKASTDYTLTIKFLDESKPGQTEDITEEVEEENDEHLVCFQATGQMPAPAIADKDAAGKPLGLESTLKTTTAGAGTLMVTLKHQPDKGATAPCSTGETDVEVNFTVAVEN